MALDWEALRSPEFVYLILPESIVAPDDLVAHYEAIGKLYADIKEPGTRYLGRRLDWMSRPVECPHYVRRESVIRTMETPEVAIRLSLLYEQLAKSVESNPNITCHLGRRVDLVERSSSGFRIKGTANGEAWQHESEIVVNCLWGGRLEIDNQLGIVPARKWVYRLKYRVFATLPPSLKQMKSLSMALGPFGDVVPNADEIYLQWYPACRRGWSEQLKPPASWDRSCDRESGQQLLQEIGADARRGFSRFLPDVSDSELLRCDAGVIFSWGETDIDQIDSEFHQRYQTGVHSHDGYFSIDTGKLTCAPLFAERLRQQLESTT